MSQGRIRGFLQVYLQISYENTHIRQLHTEHNREFMYGMFKENIINYFKCYVKEQKDKGTDIVRKKDAGYKIQTRETRQN